MSDLPPGLEERIARLEGGPQDAVGADFNLGSWAWMIALGIVLPAALLAAGWWYAPSNF